MHFIKRKKKDILDQILDLSKNNSRFFVQTHNFPDHDAVASAFGVQYLLLTLGLKTQIIYAGEIERDSLKRMISELNIDIQYYEEVQLQNDDKIIIVDGCKGNKNITDLTGEEIAVIDHHQGSKPEDISLCDIRSSYGACSTIVYTYFEERNIPIPKDISTALMIGINMDTAQLTRHVSQKDIHAYGNLFSSCDMRLQNSILRNYIQTKDLNFYRYAIENIKIFNSVAFCYFPDGCNQNLLGILGDFFLALEEVDFVILCANNNQKINFSIRNENDDWNAAHIIQLVLKGIGFGGGHKEMAGGIIKNIKNFYEKEIFQSFLSVLGKR